MSAGTELGNFKIDEVEMKARLTSVQDGSFMTKACNSLEPWFVPEKSIGKVISNYFLIIRVFIN